MFELNLHEETRPMVTSRLPVLRRTKPRVPLSTEPSNTQPTRMDTPTSVSNIAEWTYEREVPKQNHPSGQNTLSQRLDTTSDEGIIRNARSVKSNPSVSYTSDSRSRIRDEHPQSLKTPSLFSGSSLSISNGPHSPLRRKTPTIARYAASVNTDQHCRQEDPTAGPLAHKADPFPSAIFGMTLPPIGRPKLRVSREESSFEFPQRSDATRLAATRGHGQGPQSLAIFPESATSSLRNSDSPFSILSTPTSVSSYSPTQSRTTGPRIAIGSPVKEAGNQKGERGSTLRHDASQPTVTDRATRDAALQQPRQVPPELAHLNVDHVTSSNATSRTIPRRPSRDGTSDITDHQVNSSIVYSDIPSTFATRRPSLETPESTRSRSRTKRFFGFSNRSSSRQGTPRVDSATPESIRVSEDSEFSRQDSPMVGFTMSPGRRHRPEDALVSHKGMVPGSEKPQRTKTRGPAAGTGHEGYSTHGFRGRSRSIFGGAFGRSSSTDSTTSTGKRSLFGRKPSPMLRGRESCEEFSENGTRPEGREDHDVSASLAHPYSGASGVLHNELEVSPRSTTRIPRSPVQPAVMNQYGRVKEAGNEIASNVTTEGKEGYWLRSSKQKQRSPSPYNFAQRLFGRPASNSKKNHPGDQGLGEDIRHGFPHYVSPGTTTTVVSANDIRTIVDMEVQTSLKQVAPQHNGHSTTQVPFSRRHEGLMPAPATLTRTERDQSHTALPDILLWGGSTAAHGKKKAPTAQPISSPPRANTPGFSIDQESRSAPAPRLSPVGRIPQVLSSRDQERELSDHSFSRPFANASQPCDTSSHTDMLANTGSHSAKKLTVDRASVKDTCNNASSAKHDDHGIDHFLEFRTRNNSDLSYTSSSGIASPNTARGHLSLQTDDSWSEYNDLYEDIMLAKSVPISSHRATTSSVDQRPVTEPQIRCSRQDVNTARPYESTRPVPLGHRLSTHGQATVEPSTPFSISDYLDEGQRTSTSSSRAQSFVAPQGGPGVDASNTPGFARTGAAERAQKETGPSQPGSSNASNISLGSSAKIGSPPTGEFRHAALVTSKWLSFGRVLFSPVHNEAKIGNDTRILILDGLGKEWSYYCALSYPKCQFYHLGPEPSVSGNDAVANYRHIPHASLSTPFPFPRGFFSGIVLRFPRVTSDDGYQSCMSEVKRTLRSGGYLEMSTIDIDLMNMGSKARKAIKDLKVQLHERDESLSLWNQGDAFLKLLGRRGFESIQRCVVALPAAGRAYKSQDSTRSSSSRRGSLAHTMSLLDMGKEVEGPGLADLLRNSSQDSQLDEQITKTVAKVGRWWYSTCYEEMVADTKSATTEGQSSLWATPGLMREMERHGTCLRLLICYAQKPDCSKRRTASV